MPNFRVLLWVHPQPGVRDPQGEAVQEVLQAAAGDGAVPVEVQWVGRCLQLQLQAVSAAAARQQLDSWCTRLLVNPHLETYSLTLEEVLP